MSQLKLVAGSRPATLLARLDAAYFAFAAGLPPSLQRAARRRSTFSGLPEDHPFEGPSTMNPGVTCTPWLFWELIQGLEDETILSLAEGGTLVVLALVILDHLIDGQMQHPTEAFLLHQALFQGGTARLRAKLHHNPRFWAHFDRLISEHLEGFAAELDVLSYAGHFTLESFLHMVPRKLTPTVIPMAALLEELGQGELVAPIETSIKHLTVACQLLDDVDDWQRDLEAGHLTFFLTRTAPPEVWQQPEWPSVEAVRERIDADWLDLKYMEQAREWLDKALGAVSSLACPAWNEYIDGYHVLADEYLRRCKARFLLNILDPLFEDPTG